VNTYKVKCSPEFIELVFEAMVKNMALNLAFMNVTGIMTITKQKLQLSSKLVQNMHLNIYFIVVSDN